MKKILDVKNSADAHLVVEALRQEGIAASVQGEWGSVGEGPSVWIENDADAERANALVAETTIKDRPAPTPVPGRQVAVYVGGLLLAMLLGVVIGAVFNGRVPETQEAMSPQSWDANGDGRPDNWASYDTAGRLVESSEDRNLDGIPDSWVTYDPPGVLAGIRDDQDFDGREDSWVVYEKGVPVWYTADNDRNGVVDEWGRFENGSQVERNWSFSNDRIADRRAIYRVGRKIREEYDRNRDGVVEETVLFDEFERVISSR